MLDDNTLRICYTEKMGGGNRINKVTMSRLSMIATIGKLYIQPCYMTFAELTRSEVR